MKPTTAFCRWEGIWFYTSGPERTGVANLLESGLQTARYSPERGSFDDYRNR